MLGYYGAGPAPDPANEKEKAMNEFQAILTVVVYFVVRIGVPALLIYALTRLIRHCQGPDPMEDEAPETRVAH